MCNKFYIILQRSLYKKVRNVPEELQSAMDDETFSKARLYQIDKSVFGFYSGVYSQIEMSVSN